MDERRLATISFCSKDNVEENLKQAFNAIDKAVDLGADWIMLPEVWTYQGPYQELFKNADSPRGPIYEKLAEKAASHKVCLFAGSYGERLSFDGDKDGLKGDLEKLRISNVSYIFDRNGQEVACYRKTHLFNLYDQNGQALYCESDGFLPGDQRVVFDLEGWRIGMSICYDLRFPGLYQAMAREKPLDLITVPAAFTLETGKDHWELLLRARAVELQCYVFAANQNGESRPGRRCYGHSMIVEPWGEKIADTGEYDGIALASISKSHLNRVRQRLPALKNQRPELY